MRFRAWLDSTPEKGREPRGKRYVGALPPMGPMPELIEYLFAAGPVEHSGMGFSPLSWVELLAWQDATGVSLDPFEAQAVRDLSLAYVDQYERGKAATCPPPWIDPEYVDRQGVGKKILSQFRAFQQRRQKQRGVRRG